jgi:hypothetical protein
LEQGAKEFTLNCQLDCWMIRQSIEDEGSRITLYFVRGLITKAGLRDSQRGGLAGALVGLHEDACCKQQIAPVMFESLMLLSSNELSTKLTARGIHHDFVR